MSKKIKITVYIMAFVGVLIFYYPSIANFINNNQNDILIREYNSQIKGQNLSSIREKAVAYNADRKSGKYSEQLKVSDDGMMGYITIPKISLELPIYHGTESNTLLKGVGHLKTSSLPVGGSGTHCVLTGHSGLSSQDMFNSLTAVKVGDVFYLNVAGQKLVYKVDKITTVKPTEVSNLYPTSGKDYCTLVTCTPYGVNTHRLLVRGERTDDENLTDLTISRKDNTIIKIIITMILVIVLIQFIDKKGRRHEK